MMHWCQRSKVLTQYCLRQTNLRSSVFLKAVGAEVKIGLNTGGVALSEDGALETFVTRVFGMDDELDGVVIVMMFPRSLRVFGRFDC